MGALLLLLPTVLGGPYRFGRSAALFYGKLPRDGKHKVESVLLFEGLVRPSIRASVLRPFAEAAASVDVLVHTWESSVPNLTAGLRAPLERMRHGVRTRGAGAVRIDKPMSDAELLAKAPFWCPRHVHQINGLVSMERVVHMASHFERAGKRPYDLMLLMRLDLYFFRPFSFASLDAGPFYMANWCDARGPVKRPNRALECKPLVQRERELLAPQGMAPDFYFLSSGANMKKVFSNITGLAGRAPRYYRPEHGAVCGNERHPKTLHGAIIPVLRGLMLEHLVRRYLFHHLDFAFCRWPKLTWETFRCAEQGGGWLAPPPDTSAWTGKATRSFCPNDVMYCHCTAPRVPTSRRCYLGCRGRHRSLCSNGTNGSRPLCTGGDDDQERVPLGMAKFLEHYVYSHKQPRASVTSRTLTMAIALARRLVRAGNASRRKSTNARRRGD
eukprot:TRINITY_DN5768_c0_g1_i1.p1 TRINITY_DN5768_c0_g1~~TRINITY_DN5768_c0_g1_i1.p1  ORF type:complete len:463 (+),score=37.64 TRINITY_DN5768_c0_g1_i1:66-1391(+)